MPHFGRGKVRLHIVEFHILDVATGRPDADATAAPAIAQVAAWPDQP